MRPGCGPCEEWGRVGISCLYRVLCHLVIIHIPCRSQTQAGFREDTHWGSAQTKAPCPPLPVSAEMQPALTHTISSGDTVSCEAASRVWGIAGQRGLGRTHFPMLKRLPGLMSPSVWLCQAKLPIKAIALKTFPNVLT